MTMNNKNEQQTGTKRPWRTMTIIFIAMIAIFFSMDANPSLYIYDAAFTTTPHLQSTFEGKRIWITGASSGIGAELSLQLCSLGANTIISARNEEKLQLVASRCPSPVTVVPLDVTSPISDIRSTIDRILAQVSEIDILILNAGQYSEIPVLQTETTVWENIMDLNFSSQIRLAMEVIKHDKWQERQFGHIVVMSSLLGKVPAPLNGAYSASKHALQAFFATLRVENPWLRVDLICPGAVDTSIMANSKILAGMKSFAATIPGKMSVSRCVKLIISGMSGPGVLFFETWIATQPTLSIFYFAQYAPALAYPWLDMVGKFMIESWKRGDGFNLW